MLRPATSSAQAASEAIYEVRITTNPDHLIDEVQLETASYPLRNIEVAEQEPDTVEVVTTLVGTSANRDELERVISALKAAAFTRDASWAARTAE